MAADTKLRDDCAKHAAGPENSANRAAEQKLHDFLEALTSYPERFAHDPQVSFEEHLVMVAAAGQGSSRN